MNTKQNASNQRVTMHPGFLQQADRIIATGKPYTVRTVVTTENDQKYEVCFDMLEGGMDEKALQDGVVMSLATIQLKSKSKPVNICLMDCKLMASA